MMKILSLEDRSEYTKRGALTNSRAANP